MSLELTIGGIRFLVDPPPGKKLVERDTTYVSFLTHGPTPDVEVAVEVTGEPAPDPSGLPLLFQTEETWTAYDDDGDIVLRLSAGPSADYLWQAHLHSEGQRVRVHCGPAWVSGSDSERELANPVHYPLDQLLLMFLLPVHQGILIHAAGLARNGRGVFCAGRSGAGKTTLMRQHREHHNLRGLSDDRVIIRLQQDVPRVYGTPWAGEGRVAENQVVDLAAITFLHQSSVNELRPISPSEALAQLMATVSILWFDRQRLDLAMNVSQQLVTRLPCYELHCRPEPAALELLDVLI